MTDVTPSSVRATERVPPDQGVAVARILARLAWRAARAQRQRQMSTETPSQPDKSQASD